MSDSLHIAEERVRWFERLGGVDLSRLEPEPKDALLAEIQVGIASHKKAIFHFVCPLCGNRATNDQDLSPACTGPSWTDDHPLTPMVEVKD